MADEPKAPAKPAGAPAAPAAPGAPAAPAAPAAAAPAAPAKPGKEPPKKDAKDAKGAAPGKKGGPLPLIAAIVGGLVVLIGASLALIYVVLLPRLKTAEVQAKAAPPPVEASAGPVFNVKDMVINSADRDEIHYFKVGLALEVGTPKAVEELGARDAQVRDLLISEFSQYTVRELNSAQGREKIRHDLIQKLGARLGHIPVKNVYFTEYVGQ
ncbi:MAG TPA: flagellar basal body-associated FliL family protein [Candidatus Saccharimonadales bacterium]|nr:flagellar basal body-associated FliL family protein [Candidatus Saccharimonadales bacterium]